MAGSITRSIELVKESYRVLKNDKQLLILPLMSGIACLVFIAVILVPAFILGSQPDPGLSSEIFLYGGLFLFYLIMSFIVVFFNSALITCVYIRLTGGDPTLSDGISNAKGHIGKIFIWALLSATVGVILSIVRDNTNFLGQLIISFIGMAWSLVTYFVVPVIIIEDQRVIASIKESAQLFRKTWGGIYCRIRIYRVNFYDYWINSSNPIIFSSVFRKFYSYYRGDYMLHLLYSDSYNYRVSFSRNLHHCFVSLRKNGEGSFTIQIRTDN